MSTTPRDTLGQLAQNEPLASPLVTSLACFEYGNAPPEHVRSIYGDVRRGLSPKYPNAPKNLVKLMPREHAKSEAGAVVVPTWKALENPSVRILIMSETETQAAGKLEECSEHIERLAPRFGREITKNSYTEFTLEREATWDQPTIKAAGFETGVTGGHYDLLIFDDLVSYDTQRTPGMREKAWSKFQDYLNLGSEGESVFLVLGTRKHPKDLYNQLLKAPVWKSDVRRAISDWSIVKNGEYHVRVRHDDTHEERDIPAGEIGTIDGESETIISVEPHRDVDVLWPERWPLDALLMDMLTGYGEEASTLIWQRENQNNPDVLKGEVLSEGMLYYADSLPYGGGFRWMAGIDLGVEDDPEKAATNDTDYWAVSVLAHHARSGTTYAVKVPRRRGMKLKAGIKWVKEQLQDVREEYGAEFGSILAESNQAQRWFVQTAQEAGLDVDPAPSSGGKEGRIIDMSSRFESGKVKLLEDGPEDGWEGFVSEWCAFPSGDHDDRLDAIEIALRALDTDDTVTNGFSMEF